MSAAPSTAPARVLVVEDERSLADIVAAYLTQAGFDVQVVGTGPDAVRHVRDQPTDVVVLDLGLPGMDGIEVCRQLRTFSDCYVVVTTARKDEVDTLIGLSVGADDYMTKPFSVRELVARVHALLRRPRTSPHSPSPASPQPSAWTFGDLVVDPLGLEVHLAGESVALTPTERDLLMTLAERPAMAFSRRQLIDAVWGGGWVGDEHLVDVHIAHLRKKLGDDPETARYVTTVRGVGYRMGRG